MHDHVILVDGRDRELGTAAKLAAHVEGRLHRAFSIFIIDHRGALLLQRRARDKYHSGGLWSNACCSHPRPGESIAVAAQRRLREEMGFDCPLSPAFCFTYRERVGAHLWEHELDHVLLGRWNGVPTPDPAEVAEWRWASIDDVRDALAREPATFTAWFPLALQGLLARGLVREPQAR